MNLKLHSLISALLVSASFVTTANVQADDIDNVWSAIKSLQEKVEATAEAIDMAESSTGHGLSGKTSIGGYGELHYNNLDSKKEMDFHRAVLFVGHEFSDDIRFFMEWDLEHAAELDLEQAYLSFDLNDKTTLHSGVMLIPVGITNETHEPPTFYGIERNPVENKIIPTTWREGGVGVSGELTEGWSYDIYLTSGLKATGPSYSIRSGRQKVSEAVADNLAATGRIKWTGVPGVEIAASYQVQDDISQGLDATAGSASLLEAHAVATRGAATVKALYASWDLEGSGPEAIGADEQTGWYIEPSYKLSQHVGVFARFNEWDNTAGSATDTKTKQTEFGVNFWPHENVVVKVDVMEQSGAGTDEGFNLGVGYYF